MIVRGAVTGPYSMAAELMGAEKFMIATVEEPGLARRLLEFTARLSVLFGRAFIERGAEPIVFDSRATPRLASPRVFREMVGPLYRDFIVPELTRAGARHVTVILGGNTDAVVDDLVATRPAQLLCDAGSSLALFRERCLGRVAFRANVDARLVHRGRRTRCMPAQRRF
jgi:uroporphyrinogen-III decarboxylase